MSKQVVRWSSHKSSSLFEDVLYSFALEQFQPFCRIIGLGHLQPQEWRSPLLLANVILDNAREGTPEAFRIAHDLDRLGNEIRKVDNVEKLNTSPFQELVQYQADGITRLHCTKTYRDNVCNGNSGKARSNSALSLAT